ncbi:MAG TPA: hypothetical protein VFC41_01770, partial [Anaerovoracaceae bacterium]|nr:hypothetical protein [Anaerovoracaceae bacterium]
VWKDTNSLNEVAMALINFLTSHDATDAANSAARTWYIDNPEKIMEVKRQDKLVEEQLKIPKRIVIKARQTIQPTTPHPIQTKTGAQSAQAVAPQTVTKIRINK